MLLLMTINLVLFEVLSRAYRLSGKHKTRGSVSCHFARPSKGTQGKHTKTRTHDRPAHFSVHVQRLTLEGNSPGRPRGGGRGRGRGEPRNKLSDVERETLTPPLSHSLAALTWTRTISPLSPHADRSTSASFLSLTTCPATHLMGPG